MLSAFAPLLFSCVVAGDTPSPTALLEQSGSIGARYVLILDAKGRLFDYPLTPVNEEASERWLKEIKDAITSTTSEHL